jgi:hypothetical protein
MSTLPTYGNMPTVIDPTAWSGRTIDPPASVNADALQLQIAAQLSSFFQSANLSIPIYIWPNFDLDTWWKGNAIAFVLISLTRATLSKPESTSAMMQEKTWIFTLHVEARKKSWALTGAGSVYALMAAIESALSGFGMPGCRNAYFTEEHWGEERNDGRIWLFDLLYNVVTILPKSLPQYALAELGQLIFNITPSGDEVTVPAE